MPYQEVHGLRTVFPTAPSPGARTSSAPAKRKRAAPRKRSAARAAPAPKKQRPCKYGRGADGYCNKKPTRAEADLGDETSILDRPAPKKRKRQTIGKRIETQVVNSTTRAAQRGAIKVVSKVQKAGGVKAILAKPVSVGVGAATVGTGAAIAAAAAVGVAAFLATTAILNAIKNKKERDQQAAFEASQAFRKARLSLEKNLGRKLSVPELQQLHAQFTVGLKNRGW